MSKLFSGHDYEGNLTISNEMIDYQHNDYIVPAVIECFKDIIEFHNRIKPMNSYKFFESREGSTLFKKLDMLISKRFGINFRHAATMTTAYAVYTVPPKNFNVLYRDIEADYVNTANYLKHYNVNKDTAMPAENIKNADTHYNDLLLHWSNSINSLDKTLGKNGIIVDLHKARITGLPNDYVVFLVINICSLIDDLKLDAEEMASTLIHEIGHAFTHIEYSNRAIANTAVLIDTVRENVGKHNGSAKDSMLLVYKRMYNTVPAELEKSNVMTIALATVERFFKESAGFNPSGHSHIDSEQLADQFAGRFELSAPLATALEKIYKKYGDSITNLLTVIEVSSFAQVFGMAYIASLVYISGSLAMPVAIVLTISYLVIYLIESYLTAGGLTNLQTYAANSVRLTQIRNELVRKLRNSDFNKEIVDSILTQVDMLDKIIESTPDMEPSFINNLMQKYTSKGKQLTELKQLELLSESLMENDLHLAAARLNTLK